MIPNEVTRNGENYIKGFICMVCGKAQYPNKEMINRKL
jgi:hypothetical protein